MTLLNSQLLAARKTKPKAPKGIEPSQEAESYYAAQLQSMVRLMSKELYAAIEPALKQLKPQYYGDAMYVRDSWSDDIVSIIRRIASQFTSVLFQAQTERISRRTVSMADADNAQAFQESVNRAVGIPFEMIVQTAGMTNSLDAAVNESVGLIRSIPTQYFQRIETIVLDNMRQGFAPTKIAKDIQAETGVTYRRAKLIARDQVAKVNSDLTRARQAQAGIEFYKSSNSDDSRVSGKPGGKYPNAKISCWGISKQDIGYGPGIYKLSDGAPWAGQTGLHPGRHHPLCRCVAIAQIVGVNYFPPNK